MRFISIKDRKEFDRLIDLGLKAQNSGKAEQALKFFDGADTIARHHNDRKRRLSVLNPTAQVLWSLGQYEKAKQKLALAAKIASDLALMDELAIAFSNHGRLNAVKIIKETPTSKQAKALHKDALPYFMKAYRMLEGHDHLYFRYANASYGALVAALAQEYSKAAMLSAEGLTIAFKKSRKYDREITHKLSSSGLEYFAAASDLMKLGAKNPVSRELKAQEKIARELIK
jgi:tetratricopeptide (TPR) repeat protein